MISTKAKGDEYEDFTAEVMCRIKKLEEVGLLPFVTIEQKASLIAPYGRPREIDILLTYQDSAGRNRRAAIECKGYKSPVPIDRIDAYVTKCKDLGIDTPIFAALNDFQEGAIAAAEYHGIQLVVLRKPTDADWGNLMRNLTTIITILSPSEISIYVDGKLCDNDFFPRHACLKYGDGLTTCVEEEVGRDAVGKVKGSYTFEKSYPNARMILQEESRPFSHLRIDYEMKEGVSKSEFRGDDVIRALIGVLRKGYFFVDTTGDVRRPPQQHFRKRQGGMDDFLAP